MSYATPADMVLRFGEAEVYALAPVVPKPTAGPTYDVARVEQELADASAEIDSYLANRWPTPLAETPPLIARAACVLAREGLDRQGRDPVTEAAKRIRAWLKDLAQGKATLGGGEDGAPAPEAESGGAEVIAPDRVFDDAGLAAFLR